MLDNTKMQRVLRLILLLQQGIGDMPRLTERLGVDKRSVSRYLVDLDQAGIKTYWDGSAKRYVLMENAVLKPTFFSLEEVIALLQCVDAFGQGENPLFRPLQLAKERIVGLLTPDKQPHVAAASRTLALDAFASRAKVDAELFQQVQQAAMEKRVVELEYSAASNQEANKRQVGPYFIYGHEGCWYLVAWCRLRQDWRTFSLDRIRSLKMRMEYFQEKEGFNADTYFANGLGLGCGEPETVILHFSPRRAPWLQGRIKHASQTQRMLEDGSLEMKLHVCCNWELLQWVLSFGGDVEVLVPETLRRSVVDEAAAMRRLYGE